MNVALKMASVHKTLQLQSSKWPSPHFSPTKTSRKRRQSHPRHVIKWAPTWEVKQRNKETKTKKRNYFSCSSSSSKFKPFSSGSLGIPNSQRETKNGVVEFSSARNHIPSSGMVGFHFMVHQLLPTSHLKLPQKKVKTFNSFYLNSIPRSNF